jgi:mRNA-degrading endonuclease RelE of RelBE toxin-antitoxin system
LSYEVRLSPAATRQFHKLAPEEQTSIRKALGKIAARPPGERGGIVDRRDLQRWLRGR